MAIFLIAFTGFQRTDNTKFGFIVKAPISAEMFSSASVSHGNGSLAHVYERILSFVVSACGLSLIPVDTAEPHCRERFLLWYHYNVSPFFEGIFSLTRDPVTRVKYLTLFWIRIPLPPPGFPARS